MECSGAREKEAMQRYSKKHHPGLVLSLLLIVAVAFWGGHDKVSLYKAGTHGVPVAKVKLLSGRELAADATNQVQAVLPPLLPVVLFAAFAPVLVLCVRRPLRAPFLVPSPPHSPAFARALDRRPPPCARLRS